MRAAAVIAVCLSALVLLGPAAAPGKDAGMDVAEALDWGGHLRVRGSLSDPGAGSRLDIPGGERLHDAAFEFRSKHRLDGSAAWQLDIHYEMIGLAGETRQANAAFLEQFPMAADFFQPDGASDERRLMDLTHVISGDPDHRVVHRIDRLAASLRSDRGSIRIGRQALTWGNGFLFHPMDLFNPFSPTDVARDYKIGDDMVSFQAHTGRAGEIQLLYVPRRNPANGDVAWAASSAAGKFHTYLGSLEMDILAGAHYDDAVFGLGFTGYAGGAAWRLDATYTAMDDAHGKSGYGSICANMDYSWNWWGKNMYGWIETYYTGLGTSDYESLWTDPDNRQIFERLARGERFTLGRAYFDANLRVELHPLLNCDITLITNLRDHSGVLQPRLVWDLRQNLQVTAGVNCYYGGTDTEFGGIDIPMTVYEEAPADQIYLWVYLFF